MFYLGDRPWELIISLLDVLENNFGGLWSDVSRIRKIMGTNFLHPVHRKKRIGPSRLSDVLNRRITFKTGSLPSDGLKLRLRRCWIDVSKSRKATRNNFLHPVHRKKRLGRSRLRDDLSRRIALWNHNLHSEHFKKRLWWSRWRKVSRCRKAKRTHFLLRGHQKKRLGRSRFGDVLSRRMGLRSHNLLYGRLKKRLWSSRWSDVSRCLRPYELIFRIPSFD
jgi:hypothetical protein